MANLARVRSVWSGTPIVGGGVSTFYFDEANTGFLARVNAFWTAVAGIIAPGVVIATENTGDLIDVATGTITGSWTDGSSSSVSGSATAGFAAGVGARIRWTTTGISHGRRVRGSTFIVPLGKVSYDSDGTLTPSTLTSLVNAGATMFTTGVSPLRIYTRPKGGSGGMASTVVQYSAPDKVSWLRSRRT